MNYLICTIAYILHSCWWCLVLKGYFLNSFTKIQWALAKLRTCKMYSQQVLQPICFKYILQAAHYMAKTKKKHCVCCCDCEVSMIYIYIYIYIYMCVCVCVCVCVCSSSSSSSRFLCRYNSSRQLFSADCMVTLMNLIFRIADDNNKVYHDVLTHFFSFCRMHQVLFSTRCIKQSNYNCNCWFYSLSILSLEIHHCQYHSDFDSFLNFGSNMVPVVCSWKFPRLHSCLFRFLFAFLPYKTKLKIKKTWKPFQHENILATSQLWLYG